MLAEDLVLEVAIRFYKGDATDAEFLEFKDRVRKNFEKAKIVSTGSEEAKILSVKVKEK